MLTVIVYEFPSNRAAVGKKYDTCYEVAKGERVLQSRKEALLWQIVIWQVKPQKSKVWAVSGYQVRAASRATGMALLKEGDLHRSKMQLKQTDESGTEICNSPVIMLQVKSISLVCLCLNH